MTTADLKTCSKCITFFNCLVLLLLAFFAANCSSKTNSISVENLPVKVSESTININTASIEELERLPNVGRATAKRIVEHREEFGNFRKPEHLILIRGVSDKRFREIRSFVRVK